MKLEELAAGQRLSGVVPGATVEVVAAVPHGADATQLIYRDSAGIISEEIVYRADEDRFELAVSSLRPFDAPASDFKVAAEAQRIRLAGLYDPMLAVATSAVQPLPHQIRAVYGAMLPRTPLRFLLADDPGAGKTIMAGLFIKELLLRGDVQRCLIVAPGGLVEQWQDELYTKFGLRFEILDARHADGPFGTTAFDDKSLLIARMDQLARNETLLSQLDDVEFDLVVVDEAHRMSAHYFGAELKKSKRFTLGEKLGRRTRHLLLMTATPHAGKHEDFALFMTLLDRDRFEGRLTKGVHQADTNGLMSRSVGPEDAEVRVAEFGLRFCHPSAPLPSSFRPWVRLIAVRSGCGLFGYCYLLSGFGGEKVGGYLRWTWDIHFAPLRYPTLPPDHRRDPRRLRRSSSLS